MAGALFFHFPATLTVSAYFFILEKYADD